MGSKPMMRHGLLLEPMPIEQIDANIIGRMIEPGQPLTLNGVDYTVSKVIPHDGTKRRWPRVTLTLTLARKDC